MRFKVIFFSLSHRREGWFLCEAKSKVDAYSQWYKQAERWQIPQRIEVV